MKIEETRRAHIDSISAEFVSFSVSEPHVTKSTAVFVEEVVPLLTEASESLTMPSRSLRALVKSGFLYMCFPRELHR